MAEKVTKEIKYCD